MTAPDKTAAMTAVALAGRIDLDAAVSGFAERPTRRDAHSLVYDLGADGTLYVFNMGAVVQDGSDGLLPEVRAQVERATGQALLEETSETYFIEIGEAPGRAARVGWDRVTVPERSPLLIDVVALLLAESAALERYETTAEALLDETLLLCRDLTARGQLPSGTRALVQRVGRLTRDRLELARWFYLVDRPEETWEDPRVSALYDSLFANLELQQRHQAMLHKLEAVEQTTRTTLELWHGRRSNALEWAIVVLIMVEIVFGVTGLW